MNNKQVLKISFIAPNPEFEVRIFQIELKAKLRDMSKVGTIFYASNISINSRQIARGNFHSNQNYIYK